MSYPELIDQLRRIWVLDLVVTHGSFRVAAAEARVTRSAVSQTVSQLEKSLGSLLLIRDRGRVIATPQGEQLLARAKPLLMSLQTLNSGAEPRSTAMPASIELGVWESLGLEIVPELVQSLQRRYPGIRVTVRVGRTAKLASMVRRGELHAAVVTQTDRAHGLATVSVAEERLGLYLSSSTAPSGVSHVPLGSITAGSEGHPAYYSRFVRALSLEKQPSFYSDSYQALLQAVCFGTVIGILPARVAARRKGELIEITPGPVRQKAIGGHDIVLMSRQNFREIELDFLAAELRRFLSATDDAESAPRGLNGLTCRNMEGEHSFPNQVRKAGRDENEISSGSLGARRDRAGSGGRNFQKHSLLR